MLQHHDTAKGFKAVREFQLYAAGKLMCGCLGRKEDMRLAAWMEMDRDDMSVPKSKGVSVDATSDLQQQIMTNT